MKQLINGNIKKELKVINSKARMSPALKKKTVALESALKQNDLVKAMKISEIHKHICPVMTAKKCAYKEDSDYNSKILNGCDVYCHLDGIGFQIGMLLHKIKSV